MKRNELYLLAGALLAGCGGGGVPPTKTATQAILAAFTAAGGSSNPTAAVPAAVAKLNGLKLSGISVNGAFGYVNDGDSRSNSTSQVLWRGSTKEILVSTNPSGSPVGPGNFDGVSINTTNGSVKALAYDYNGSSKTPSATASAWAAAIGDSKLVAMRYKPSTAGVAAYLTRRPAGLQFAA